MSDDARAEPLTGSNELATIDACRSTPSAATVSLPVILTSAGEDAVTRFVEYFTAHIRNPHTRRAYFRNAVTFLRWCERRGIQSLKEVKPVTVAAYIELLQTTHAKPTVKQHLATIRMLFDWLVIGQVVPVNPAHAVRGPKHVVTKGKTPVLTAEETRTLFESIVPDTVVDKRDRARSRRCSSPSPAWAPSSPCRSTITTPRANATGCVSTKKTASSTRCRPTIPWRSISTPTCTRRASPATTKARSSARRPARAAR